MLPWITPLSRVKEVKLKNIYTSCILDYAMNMDNHVDADKDHRSLKNGFLVKSHKLTYNRQRLPCRTEQPTVECQKCKKKQHSQSLQSLDQNASKLNKNKLSAFNSRCKVDSHGKIHGVEELLEQLRCNGYSRCRPRVQAKAAFIAVGGTVVVARSVEALAQHPA